MSQTKAKPMNSLEQDRAIRADGVTLLDHARKLDLIYERLAKLEKLLEGTEDFNLPSVIHNFRYMIEKHSARLRELKESTEEEKASRSEEQ